MNYSLLAFIGLFAYIAMGLFEKQIEARWAWARIQISQLWIAPIVGIIFACLAFNFGGS